MVFMNRLKLCSKELKDVLKSYLLWKKYFNVLFNLQVDNLIKNCVVEVADEM